MQLKHETRKKQDEAIEIRKKIFSDGWPVVQECKKALHNFMSKLLISQPSRKGFFQHVPVNKTALLQIREKIYQVSNCVKWNVRKKKTFIEIKAKAQENS